jgi:hypothetical protein
LELVRHLQTLIINKYDKKIIIMIHKLFHIDSGTNEDLPFLCSCCFDWTDCTINHLLDETYLRN